MLTCCVRVTQIIDPVSEEDNARFGVISDCCVRTLERLSAGQVQGNIPQKALITRVLGVIYFPIIT